MTNDVSEQFVLQFYVLPAITIKCNTHITAREPLLNIYYNISYEFNNM